MAKNGSENKIKVLELKQEIGLLRSFMIGLAGRDKEGFYRPDFVFRVLSSLTEKGSRYFRNPRTFLRELRNLND